jgi:alkylation response protein AidB-like acyl-CoA dehydrogenase
MELSFTEEQTLLRSSLSAFLTDHYDFETRRRVAASEPGWRSEIWRAFAELGVLGASLPGDVGGSDGGPVETLVIMEELGKALVIEPYLSTVVVAGGLLRRSDTREARRALAAIVAGDARAAFALAEPHARYRWRDLRTTARRDGAGYKLQGRKAMVVGAPFATHLVVVARSGGAADEAAGVSTFWVETSTAGITTQDYQTIDGGRASEVMFDNVSVPAEALILAEGEAWPELERVIDEATAAMCAESVGVLRRMHEMTVDYTKNRRQFGQALSAFPVLRHRMVDMFIQLEQTISATWLATIRLSDSDPAQRARAVSAAKAQAGLACRSIGHGAIQLHGAMGMTDELAVGHYFKRATVIESQFGDTDHHLARYEALAFAGVGAD